MTSSLYCVETGCRRAANLSRMRHSVVVLAESPDAAVQYVRTNMPHVLHGATVQRVFPVQHVIVHWPSGACDITERKQGAEPHRAFVSLLGCGQLASRLTELSDRQVGQLMFDSVWDEFALTSPAMSIAVEATHRLFRSSGGPSTGEIRLNDPNTLPTCPQCGEPMLFYVGIDELDFWRCVALRCRHKTRSTSRRTNGSESVIPDVKENL